MLFELANPKPQRRHYRLRDEKIAKLSESLKNKTISVDVFLNGIIAEENDILKDCCSFDENANLFDDDDFYNDNEINTIATSYEPSSAVLHGSTCIVCLAQQSDVLLSCGHYKYCLNCFELLRAHYDEKLLAFNAGDLEAEPKFKCYFCNIPITNHMHIKRIFSCGCIHTNDT